MLFLLVRPVMAALCYCEPRWEREATLSEVVALFYALCLTLCEMCPRFPLEALCEGVCELNVLKLETALQFCTGRQCGPGCTCWRALPVTYLHQDN